MLDKLIWSNYCLKYLILKETPNYEYNDDYEQSDSKFTHIRVDGNNKEMLDNIRAARWKSNFHLSWILGNPDPNKKRTYFWVFDLPTLIKPKKTYDHIINELIDNYQPFSNLGFRDASTAMNNSSDGNTITMIVDNKCHGKLITLDQHTQQLKDIERFSEIGGLDDDDDDEDFSIDNNILPSNDVIKNQVIFDSIFRNDDYDPSNPNNL